MPDERVAPDYDDPAPPAVQARVLAAQVLGTEAVATLGRQSLTVGYRHTWRMLWAWWFDSRELLAELLIDPRIPPDQWERIAQMFERTIDI